MTIFSKKSFRNIIDSQSKICIMCQKQLIFSILKKNEDLKFEEFSDFVNLVSDDFRPSFLSYVKLQDYYEKVVQNGTIAICRSDKQLAGVLFFYCNNYESKIAYASFLAVSPFFRKLGIAKSMMQIAIDFSKESGMKSIKLRTNNEIALKTYLDLGYELTDKVFEKEVGLIRYYLQKKI